MMVRIPQDAAIRSQYPPPAGEALWAGALEPPLAVVQAETPRLTTASKATETMAFFSM
jgi:hypothetical protein